MNRWYLYELFKGTRFADDATVEQIEKMSEKELKEGVIEFLIMKRKNATKVS